MPGQIFISYSHEDAEFFKAFQEHIRPFVVTGSLDIWDDQHIDPNQKWHDEIQQALDQATAAVLLVSPSFLASDYIREHELPHLLRAREEERIGLFCLYVRYSTIAEHSFDITLSSGDTKQVKLTDYQGLNSPNEVIASREHHERDRLYARAVSTLMRVIEDPGSKAIQLAPIERYDLTIHLTLEGQKLRRAYLTPSGRIGEDEELWQGYGRDDLKPDLFQMLFSTQTMRDDIFTRLFRCDPAPPIRHPVRVRLYTNVPEIAELPWPETTWEGNLLCDYGWTFECIGSNDADAVSTYPNITLRTPCSVLMIASSQAPQADVHYRDLEERLHHAWPQHHEKPHWAKTWVDIETAWQEHRPRIVYYYGPTNGDGQTVTLQLDDIPQCPVSKLVQLWGNSPPDILFCNIVESSAALGIAMAHVPMPLVITQHTYDAIAARNTALNWMHELLESGQDTDPVWALHQHGLSTAVAWGAYNQWRTQTFPKPNTEHLARLLIDRKVQRSLASTAIGELLRDSRQRLYCMLAYGAEGNLATLFAAQLYEHLRRESRQVLRVPVRLPQAASFDLDKLAFEVRRQWILGDRESYAAAMVKRKPRGPARARPILLLDWGVRGTEESNRIAIEALEAWIAFCQHHLATQCPKELRLVSCLALEMPPERHPTLERIVHDDLRPRYRDRAFRLELLPRLDVIDANELADFLIASDHSSCPPGSLNEISTLIIRKTHGQFQETVELVERAERSGWLALKDELTASLAQASSRTLERGTLL